MNANERRLEILKRTMDACGLTLKLTGCHFHCCLCERLVDIFVQRNGDCLHTDRVRTKLSCKRVCWIVVSGTLDFCKEFFGRDILHCRKFIGW